jgi:hypothetical protein
MHLSGRSRDLLTDPDGRPHVIGQAEMEVRIGDLRTIDAIEVSPAHEGIQDLVGASGGRGLRRAIDAALPGEREAATPLYFILDDIAGATLIGGFAWAAHRPMGPSPASRSASGDEPRPTPPRRTRDGRTICSGLRPGGYAEISRDRQIQLPHFLRLAGDLSNDDPWAWHDIGPTPQVCMRRRRRIDFWPDGDMLAVDAHFRDSMWDPDHRELAVHEYTIEAMVDAATNVLTSIEVEARVLPFPECPWAAPHTSELVGMKVDSFRTSVQDALTELHCCTHLNDMLRGLAEVPSLAAAFAS